MKKLIVILGVAFFATVINAQVVTNTTQTKLAGVVYGTYVKDVKRWGGGVLGAYNFNNNAGLVVGLDYIDEFLAVSGGVQLQLPTRPLESIGYTNFYATPFVLTAVGTSMSGAGTDNNNAQVIYAAGMKTDIYKANKYRVFGGFAIGTRTGAGAYSGQYLNLFAGASF
jgi:hypothetical protein